MGEKSIFKSFAVGDTYCAASGCRRTRRATQMTRDQPLSLRQKGDLTGLRKTGACQWMQGAYGEEGGKHCKAETDITKTTLGPDYGK